MANESNKHSIRHPPTATASASAYSYPSSSPSSSPSCSPSSSSLQPKAQTQPPFQKRHSTSPSRTQQHRTNTPSPRVNPNFHIQVPPSTSPSPKKLVTPSDTANLASSSAPNSFSNGHSKRDDKSGSTRTSGGGGHAIISGGSKTKSRPTAFFYGSSSSSSSAVASSSRSPFTPSLKAGTVVERPSFRSKPEQDDPFQLGATPTANLEKGSSVFGPTIWTSSLRVAAEPQLRTNVRGPASPSLAPPFPNVSATGTNGHGHGASSSSSVRPFQLATNAAASAAATTCAWIVKEKESVWDPNPPIPCGRKFVTPELLARHIIHEHTFHPSDVKSDQAGEKKIRCRWKDCNNRSYLPDQLRAHILTTHLQSSQMNLKYACPYYNCPAISTLSSEDALFYHLDLYHRFSSPQELRPIFQPQKLSSFSLTRPPPLPKSWIPAERMYLPRIPVRRTTAAQESSSSPVSLTETEKCLVVADQHHQHHHNSHGDDDQLCDEISVWERLHRRLDYRVSKLRDKEEADRAVMRGLEWSSPSDNGHLSLHPPQHPFKIQPRRLVVEVVIEPKEEEVALAKAIARGKAYGERRMKEAKQRFLGVYLPGKSDEKMEERRPLPWQLEEGWRESNGIESAKFEYLETIGASKREARLSSVNSVKDGVDLEKRSSRGASSSRGRGHGTGCGEIHKIKTSQSNGIGAVKKQKNSLVAWLGLTLKPKAKVGKKSSESGGGDEENRLSSNPDPNGKRKCTEHDDHRDAGSKKRRELEQTRLLHHNSRLASEEGLKGPIGKRGEGGAGGGGGLNGSESIGKWGGIGSDDEGDEDDEDQVLTLITPRPRKRSKDDS